MNSRRRRAKLRRVQYSTLIDAAALAPLLRDPAVAVIDCRFDLAKPAAGREAYLAAHIPGARYAGLDDVLSAAAGPGTGRHPLPSPQEFARRLGALGVANDMQVIAYDQANGAFAARLWWMLRWLGHTRAAVLDGGFAAWLAAGGGVRSGAELAERRAFRPRGARASLGDDRASRRSARRSAPRLGRRARAGAL